MSTTAADIAQQTGIAESTVRAWTRQYHVQGKKNGSKRIYPDNAADVFATIKQLKESGSGHDTIQRKISPYVDSAETPTHENGIDIARHISTAVHEAVTKSEGIAEKYARATFDLGHLQERVRCLEIEKEKLEGRLLLLPDSTEWKMTQENQAQQAYKIAELKATLENVKSENEALKKTVQEEQKRSWWDKLLGR